MMNLLSSLWGKILIIATGSAFALAGAFFLLWSSASERLSETRADLAIAVEANDANQEAIAKLQQEADTLDRLLVDALQRERTIRSQANTRRADIDDAARNNDDVADYLDQRVPDALGRLLNAPAIDENGSGEGDAPQGTDAPL